MLSNMKAIKVCKLMSPQYDVIKELRVPILKGLKHPNIILLETNCFKTLLSYATNVHLVSLLD